MFVADRVKFVSINSGLDNWIVFSWEQEFLNKIDSVSESNIKVLQQEKDKNEELSQRNKQTDEEIHEIQKIIKKMEMEHDAVLREKVCQTRNIW